jgi:hypothetical protein
MFAALAYQIEQGGLTTDGHGAANPNSQTPNPNKIPMGEIPTLAG